MFANVPRLYAGSQHTVAKNDRLKRALVENNTGMGNKKVHITVIWLLL